MITLEQVSQAEQRLIELRNAWEAANAPLNPRAVREDLEAFHERLCAVEITLKKIVQVLFAIDSTNCRHFELREEIPF